MGRGDCSGVQTMDIDNCPSCFQWQIQSLNVPAPTPAPTSAPTPTAPVSVMPTASSTPCGETTRGQQACDLSCPAGYDKQCQWNGRCDWQACGVLGPLFAQERDEYCSAGGYAHEQEYCCTCQVKANT